MYSLFKMMPPALACAALTASALLLAPGYPLAGNPADLASLLEKAEADEALFEAVLEEARKDGASEQLLLEARMVFPLSNEQYRYWEGILPAVRAHEWNFGESQLFEDEQTLDAIIAAIEARLALDSGDHQGFKEGVQKAYWLNPGLHGLLNVWIARSRIETSETRIPMDTPLHHSNGDATTLASLAEGSKAVLLDFWATWCAPCIALMPKLQERAEHLGPQGIVVAAVNTEDIERAERFRKRREIEMVWLVEQEDNRLSSRLQIDSIPRMILLDPTGRVLYDGHPTDPRLDTALTALGVSP